MTPTPWYYLRHPNGFDDEMFNCFAASCSLWQAEIEALARNWTSLPILKGMDPPRYEFGQPQRAEVPNAVVLPAGGESAYGTMKLFEDEFPATLHSHFPLTFALPLDKGRRDALGFFVEIQWVPVHPQLVSGPRRLILGLLRRCETFFEPSQMTTRRLKKLLASGALRRRSP